MAVKERTTLTEPYFELYGFDILLDRNFQAHLLEINTMPSLTTFEAVDMEVKGPLIAQALSIVGIIDASLAELIAAAAVFGPPNGGIEAFDAAIDKQEIDRNRISGDGFLRLFPDPADPLSQIMTVPPVRIERFGMERPGRGPIMLPVPETDLMALFCNVLLDLETRVRRNPPDAKVVGRVQVFLTAQGYNVKRSVLAVRSILRQFIAEVQEMTTVEALGRMKWNSYRNEDLKEMVETIDEGRVKCARLLFE
jgi:hypothetical protein